jgi:hypothetical protein
MCRGGLRPPAGVCYGIPGNGQAGDRRSPLRIGIVSMDLMRACVGAVFGRQLGFATVFRRMDQRASAASSEVLASLIIDSWEN